LKGRRISVGESLISKRRATLNFQGSRTLWGAHKRRLKPAATGDFGVRINAG